MTFERVEVYLQEQRQEKKTHRKKAFDFETTNQFQGLRYRVRAIKIRFDRALVSRTPLTEESGRVGEYDRKGECEREGKHDIDIEIKNIEIRTVWMNL